VILTGSHILAEVGDSAGETGFSFATPGGPLIAIAGAVGLLVIGIVAAALSLRGPSRGTEGTRRARRGFGPDALDAAARELRPSATGGSAPRCAGLPGNGTVSGDPARIPRQTPAHSTSPVIPEEVRAWQERRESR
jgi:hypothetical protein